MTRSVVLNVEQIERTPDRMLIYVPISHRGASFRDVHKPVILFEGIYLPAGTMTTGQ